MKTGSKSLIFGVHQFFWHPVTVWLAWVKLYGDFPSWRETVCIILHDLGYWGCSEMDGLDGELHPYVGANIAGYLFGIEYEDLVLRHSRTLCKNLNVQPSKLCWADKLSMEFDPTWFYLIRARFSGELKQYREMADRSGFIPKEAPDHCWHRKLVSRQKEICGCGK